MSESNQQGTFQLVSSYKPTGDQPQAIAKLVENSKRGQGTDAAGGDGIWQDIHHGQCYCSGTEAHVGFGAQQDVGGPAVQRIL